jgi:hypothetical protein
MSANDLPFVADEANGIWGAAVSAPGFAALGTLGSLITLSCASPGDCSAGGYAGNSTIPENPQAFVVNETAGTWQTAEDVPGIATLNAQNWASVTSISCGAPGDCSAAGYYTDAQGYQQVFIASDGGGVWSTGKELPGTAALNGGGGATIASISCRGAASCTVAGSAMVHQGTGSYYGTEPVVADEIAGAWHGAHVVPGALGLPQSVPSSISCSSPGTCTVVGSYTFEGKFGEPFFVDEVHGIWQREVAIPGMRPFEHTSGATELLAVSCVARSTCLAGGWVSVTYGARWQAMLISETPPPPAPQITKLAPSSGRSRGGTSVVVYGLHLESAMGVRFGSRAATHVVIINPDSLRVTTPPGSGTVLVKVTTSGGTSAATPRARFTYK